MLRRAVISDIAAIEEVMRASIRGLGAAFYDPAQIESACRYIARADPRIIDDGTYFVVEDDGIAACGGWSRRGRLFMGGTEEGTGASRALDPLVEPARIRAMFVAPAHARRGLGRLILEASEEAARAAGFRQVELMATLPGIPLYEVCGYRSLGPAEIELPDGTRLGAARMAKGLVANAER